MRKIIKVENKHTIKELKQRIKETNDEAQKTRIRAIISLKKGKTNQEVMEDFVIVKSTLGYGIKKYNEKGIEGLIFDKGGRKEGNPKGDKEIFDKLIKEIDKNDKLGSVPLMKEGIMKNNKIDIPQSTIGYHLQLKKYSYKSLRPSPYKGDEKAQEEFKKKDL